MEIVKNGVTYSLNIQGAEKYDVNASDDDLKIFEHIKALCPDIQLVRKTENYLTVTYKEFDVVRFKYTDRAKWLNICFLDLGKVKRRFESLEDLVQFDEDIKKSYEIALNDGYSR